MSDRSIKTGDISGTGIAVGHHASASVTISAEKREELLKLVAAPGGHPCR